MNKKIKNLVNSDHIVYSIPLSKAPELAALLDEVTSDEAGVGKKTDRFWILNTGFHLKDSGRVDIQLLNSLLNQCRVRGYSSLMISNDLNEKAT